MSVIDFDLKCAFCFTSLKGVDLEGACPLCSREVRATLDRELIDPATMTICSNVPCIQCDYNLRTLKISSVCPECAKPIAVSLEPIGLSFANVTYLREVRSGIDALLVSLLLPVGFFLLGLAIVYGISDFMAVLMVVLAVLAVGGVIITAYCWVIGIIRICTMEPHRPYPRGFGKLSGLAGLLNLCAFAGLILVPFLPFPGHMLVAFALLCLMAVMVCVALCIRHLASRARNRWLYLLSTAWTVCLSGGIVSIIDIIAGWRILSGYIAFVASVLQPLALIVCYLMSFIVLAKCRRVLTIALKGQAETSVQSYDARKYDG